MKSQSLQPRKLKLAENKSAYEKAIDQIGDSWLRWRGPSGEPWKPYDGETTPWSANVSASLDRGRYIVKAEQPTSLRRRVWRMLEGMIGKQ